MCVVVLHTPHLHHQNQLTSLPLQRAVVVVGRTFGPTHCELKGRRKKGERERRKRGRKKKREEEERRLEKERQKERKKEEEGRRGKKTGGRRGKRRREGTLSFSSSSSVSPDPSPPPSSSFLLLLLSLSVLPTTHTHTHYYSLTHTPSFFLLRTFLHFFSSFFFPFLPDTLRPLLSQLRRRRRRPLSCLLSTLFCCTYIRSGRN